MNERYNIAEGADVYAIKGGLLPLRNYFEQRDGLRMRINPAVHLI